MTTRRGRRIARRRVPVVRLPSESDNCTSGSEEVPVGATEVDVPVDVDEVRD
jgi:hypothetical protein